MIDMRQPTDTHNCAAYSEAVAGVIWMLRLDSRFVHVSKKKRDRIWRVVMQMLWVEEMRRIIENARRCVDAIGCLVMVFNGETYAMQLSRLARGGMTYDPPNGKYRHHAV